MKFHHERIAGAGGPLIRIYAIGTDTARGTPYSVVECPAYLLRRCAYRKHIRSELQQSMEVFLNHTTAT